MEENEHINQHLKQSLEGFLVQPKSASFDAVLKKMEKKKRRRFFWLFFPGLLILAAFFISELFLSSSPDTLTLKSTGIKTQSKDPVRQNVNLNQKTGPAKIQDPGDHIEGKIIKQRNNDPVVERSQEALHDKSALAEQDNLKAGKEKTTATQLPEATYNSTNRPAPVKNETGSQANNSPENFTAESDSLPVAEELTKLTMILPELKREPYELLVMINPVPGIVTDSIKTRSPKKYHVLLGINADPQLTSYILGENKNRDPKYDKNYGKPFSELYLNEKKKQNAFTFGYSYGLKLGFSEADKWEILVGIGFQRLKQKEAPKTLLDSIWPSVIPYGGFSTNNAVKADARYQDINIFNYIYYSLEAAKYLTVKKFTKLKAGLGLNVNLLRNTRALVITDPNLYAYRRSYRTEPYNSFTYALSARIGLVQELTKRMQFQISPSLYYTLNSLQDKHYVINQRPYGLKLEFLLIFKLNK